MLFFLVVLSTEFVRHHLIHIVHLMKDHAYIYSAYFKG